MRIHEREEGVPSAGGACWYVNPDLPGAGEGMPMDYLPLGGRAGRDGLLVNVKPAIGSPWFGRFGVGSGSLTSVQLSPGGDCLCVVARGAGFVVEIADPSEWRAVPLVPCDGVMGVAPEDLLVLWSFDSIVAMRRTHVVWRASAIARDGIGHVALDHGVLRGRDLARGVEFRLDLLRGTAAPS